MSGKTVTVTDGSFDTDVVKSETPVLVDFWAVWCGPCRMIAPVVEELATEYDGKVRFAKLNVDENPVIAQQYQVRAIPTLLLFKGGRIVDQIVGAVPKRVIKSKLEGVLASA